VSAIVAERCLNAPQALPGGDEADSSDQTVAIGEGDKEGGLAPERRGDALFLRTSSFKTGAFYLVLSSLTVNLLSLGLPIMMLQVYDRILVNASYGTLQILVFSVAVVIVLEALLRIARAYTTTWAGAAYEHDIGCKAYKRLFDADLLSVEKNDIGENLQRVSAIGKLREFSGGQATATLIDLPFVALFLLLIFYLSGQLVAAPIAVLVAFGFMTWIGSIELKRALAVRDEQEDRRFNFVIETLQGIHTVKAMGLESMLVRRFEQLQSSATQLNHRVSFASGGATIIGALFSEIMMITVTAAGSFMVIDGRLTIGTLIACVLLSGRIMQPIQRALGIWIRFQGFSLAREKVETIFDLPVPARVSLSEDPAKTSQLEFEAVTFGYADSEGAVLKDVTLSLERGKSISISGGPSSGKTTLLKLAAGLYRPQIGSIRLGDVDAWCIESREIAQRVGYIATQGTIFQGTISDNLTSFDRSKEATAREIVSLLGIDDVIARLPLGFETLLKDSGADAVPSGLKQCIAIARVLANKPKIILWDNADRALDRESYNAVFRLFGRLKGKVTLVIVSEDRNFLRLAQEEYELKDGRLRRRDPNADSKVHDVNQLRELWS